MNVPAPRPFVRAVASGFVSSAFGPSAGVVVLRASPALPAVELVEWDARPAGRLARRRAAALRAVGCLAFAASRAAGSSSAL